MTAQTARIHHAIARRIQAAGLDFEATPEGVVLHDPETGERTAPYADPKAAGEAAAKGTMVWIAITSEEEQTAITSEEDEEEAPKRTHSGVVPLGHHRKYMSQGGGCADTLDVSLRAEYTDDGQDLDRDRIKQLGIELGLWQNKWEFLNNGMVRMNLSNRIRGWLRNDPKAKLTIGTETGRFGVEYRPSSKAARRLAALRKAEAAAAADATPKAPLAQPKATPVEAVFDLDWRLAA